MNHWREKVMMISEHGMKLIVRDELQGSNAESTQNQNCVIMMCSVITVVNSVLPVHGE